VVVAGHTHVFSQGFRKYLTNARDHQELLSFLLGQLVKDKVRIAQLQHGTPPTEVTVHLTELEARVRTALGERPAHTDRTPRPRSTISLTLHPFSVHDYSPQMVTSMPTAILSRRLVSPVICRLKLVSGVVVSWVCWFSCIFHKNKIVLTVEERLLVVNVICRVWQ
jgi:hypothetical protein